MHFRPSVVPRHGSQHKNINTALQRFDVNQDHGCSRMSISSNNTTICPRIRNSTSKSCRQPSSKHCCTGHHPLQTTTRRSLPLSIHNHIQHHGPNEIKYFFLDHLASPPSSLPRDCRLHGGPPPFVCRLHALTRRARRRPPACLRRFVLIRPQLELYLEDAERSRWRPPLSLLPPMKQVDFLPSSDESVKSF